MGEAVVPREDAILRQVIVVEASVVLQLGDGLSVRPAVVVAVLPPAFVVVEPDRVDSGVVVGILLEVLSGSDVLCVMEAT